VSGRALGVTIWEMIGVEHWRPRWVGIMLGFQCTCLPESFFPIRPGTEIRF